MICGPAIAHLLRALLHSTGDAMAPKKLRASPRKFNIRGVCDVATFKCDTGPSCKHLMDTTDAAGTRVLPTSSNRLNLDDSGLRQCAKLGFYLRAY